MGLSCEIILYGNVSDVYQPGETIRGLVKYTTTDETVFAAITVSLKGLGKLNISKKVYVNGKPIYIKTYNNKESYVNLETIVSDSKISETVSAGTYEVPFNFVLPDKIPPTFKTFCSVDDCDVQCKVAYFIGVKFERSGFFKTDKKFKKKITVSSTVTPKLPTYPVSYSVSKIPYQPFVKNKKIMVIHGTVENSVTNSGGTVKISYKVDNGTDLDIKSVKVKLTQQTSFHSEGHFPVLSSDLKINSCKATPLKPGDTQIIDLIVDIPLSVVSMQHSTLFSREHFIDVVAELPGFHRKLILRMPIDITEVYTSKVNINDDPPSYCEAMKECQKENWGF